MIQANFTSVLSFHFPPVQYKTTRARKNICNLNIHPCKTLIIRFSFFSTELKMDADALAKAFVEHYYRTFDTNRAGLANLYQEGSMLTFEGSKVQGAQAIVEKLVALPFQQCQHVISTVDCQPSGPASGVLVFVSGSLQLAGEQHALKFSQVLCFLDSYCFFLKYVTFEVQFV